MASFHDVRLPVDVERGARGGPGFNTTVLSLSSGFEKRNQNWERARGQWDLAYGLDRKANQEAVLAFFYARRGKAYGFRFKDWTDYQVGTDASDTFQEIALGDGSQTQFQAVRRYTDAGDTFNRALTRLVSGTVRASVDGSEQTIGMGNDFTVDVATGVLTFASAPGNGLSVGLICEFDVPVRFDTDDLALRAERDDVFSFPSVPVVELREALQALS